jgi:hypothetical protein
MLQSRIQRPIPERLSHYTDLTALKSILSDQDGKGICFRAYSNKCKNDDQEIMMGKYMLERVLEVLPSGASLLNRFGGYEDTGSVSFMEGEVNEHMLDYGHYRLEFDLREIGVGVLTNGLVDCEYVPQNQLVEYADEYCEMIRCTFNDIPKLQKKFGKFSPQVVFNLSHFFMMELDIMSKVVSVKEEKWNEEREWRKLVQFKNNKPHIHYYQGKPYMNFYLYKNMLTGITVFSSKKNKDQAQKDANDIKKYVSDRGYNANVRVEVFEKLDSE